MDKKIEKITNNIKKQLKDFSQVSTIKTIKGITYKHDLSGDYETWRLARYIFSEILSFKIYDQPIEKVNWEIYFIYKEKYSGSIAHQKFGFKLYINTETEECGKEIAKVLENLLYNSLLNIHPLVEYYAKEALLNGEIIVENKFRSLFMPYDYFQKMTLRKKKVIENAKPKIKKVGNTTTMYFTKAIQEIEYYETASYITFFSLLEHICVLFLAFRNIPERKNVDKFSGLPWSDKFKKVFSIKEAEFESFYNEFTGLARYKRNPSAHGGSYTVFDFYLDGAKHKFSCSLNNNKVSIKWRNRENNLSVMDSFLELLQNHPSTHSIFTYIKSGLNVSFKKESHQMNDEISNMTKDDIDQYVHYMIGRYNDALNMDW